MFATNYLKQVDIYRFSPYAVMGLSVLGLLDASFLTFKHYFGGTIKCFVVSGCDIVTNSSYSVLFGVLPLALLGVIFYFITLLLAFLVVETNAHKIKIALLIWSGLGVISSMWFLYVQAFILKAYCFYCLISIANTIIILGLTSVILFFTQNPKK